MAAFQAGVQYGDFKGTAAADEIDMGKLRKTLETKGAISPNDVIVGISCYSGEHDFFTTSVQFTADASALQAQIASGGPLTTVKSADVDLSRDEFFGMFKRLNVVLTSRSFSVQGREYPGAN